MKSALALIAATTVLANTYIVQLQPSDRLTESDGPLDLSWVHDILAKNPDEDRNEPSSINSEYNFNGFQGFALTANERAIKELYAHNQVKHLVKERPLKLYTPLPAEKARAADATWGIDRIDQRDLPLNKIYNSPGGQGENITVYVIDTGLKADHPEFEGRAVNGPGFVHGVITETSPDDNGHGTHCAGTIASKTYGVAKKAKVVSLKVFDRTGGGDSGVIAAIQYVAKNAVPGKTVVSMSLGTDLRNCVDTQTNPTQEVCNNPIMKEALRAATELNIPFAVAAGNDATDACRVAPASEPKAYTVASSTSSDRLSGFSNHGKCVDIIAPGSSITSTWNNGRTNTISGTSMATPHVAGVMAVLLSQRSFATVEELYDAVSALATPNKFTSLPAGTVNKLLFVK
ncbi:peptidase S8/S53 domain-containing protein [Globomyces pollinis-pini]|nr:peptidase S8/S53 domain-containing protein [Globomyces pollinis-pini]